MAPNGKDAEGKSFTESLAGCEKLIANLQIAQPSLKNLTSKNFGQPRTEPNVLLESLGAPHVGSFDYMLDEGLNYAVADIDPMDFRLPEDWGGHKIRLKLEDARLCPPSVPPNAEGAVDLRVFPSETRQRGMSYKGRCVVKASYQINGVTQPSFEKILGNLPIMLKSSACHLKGLSPEELISRGEQETEWGGFFVIGGHERLIRMLQTARRNYPIAMQRPSWKNRGKNFSDLGVSIDCCKPDLTTVKNVLHFVSTGSAKMMLNVGRELFFVPIVMVLKCLSNRSDAYIYEQLIAGTDPDDHYYKGCLRNMLREPQEEGLYSSEQIIDFIGHSFRERVKYLVPDWYTSQEITAYLVRKQILIHLEDNEDKFNLIIFMVKKLFMLVQDKCVVEGVDSLMMQEIVLGGHLYLQLLKEKLENWLMSLKAAILKKAKTVGPKFELNPQTMALCLQGTLTLENVFENFLGTGNLPSITGLGLMQNKGLTIMAENINRMRYMSHFRAIHRGSFFQEMRTTEVRALLPDAWGFVCPVHTPDGAPCGLLNHLTMSVHVTTKPEDATRIPEVLNSLNMITVGMRTKVPNDAYPVLMDGRMLGYFPSTQIQTVVMKLRTYKVNPNDQRITSMTELAFVPRRPNGQYPGLFIFTGASRLMRPVQNLALNCVEWIGTFEQVYLDIVIANWDEEDLQLNPTHAELNKTSFLSNLARTIPLPDFNQSPRNMYQCQMGKQTMATPTHTWHLNAETKMYRLQTPTSPLFRPYHYDAVDLDHYAMGTNAIVAVISYTGYDMEDAMIINRASIERGFAHGTVYKSYFIDLFTIVGGRKPKNPGERETGDLVFDRDPQKLHLSKFLDCDGLPIIGTRLTDGDPMYCFRNDAEATYVVKKYEGKEIAYVDSVKLCGNDTGSGTMNRVNISLRIPRPPSIGDKFASRAGQKGICSQQWPSEDLPWTESGLVPDIVFNPHGFPSRMTIAMMIECMAGKSGAMHGLCHDATPFRYASDDLKENDAINHFGEQLEAAGYNYYGTEVLYSGTDGIPMTADIFFGVIHYQRLRHMVSDKFQVRSQGPVDMVTRQPIKGRRRGGGVRFGEMERDCLLSHGSVFLLQDRLFHGSDKTRVKVCIKCGNLLSPRVAFPTMKNLSASATHRYRELKAECVVCQEGSSTIRDLAVPYVFLHLISQLAAVNIKIKIETKYQ